jgi:hypothetical protein
VSHSLLYLSSEILTVIPQLSIAYTISFLPSTNGLGDHGARVVADRLKDRPRPVHRNSLTMVLPLSATRFTTEICGEQNKYSHTIPDFLNFEGNKVLTFQIHFFAHVILDFALQLVTNLLRMDEPIEDIWDFGSSYCSFGS